MAKAKEPKPGSGDRPEDRPGPPHDPSLARISERLRSIREIGLLRLPGTDGRTSERQVESSPLSPAELDSDSPLEDDRMAAQDLWPREADRLARARSSDPPLDVERDEDVAWEDEPHHALEREEETRPATPPGADDVPDDQRDTPSTDAAPADDASTDAVILLPAPNPESTTREESAVEPEIAPAPVQMPLRAAPPSQWSPPPGPDVAPPRVPSPTRRYWSRPRWDDVARAAAGEAIEPDVAPSSQRPTGSEPQPWTARTGRAVNAEHVQSAPARPRLRPLEAPLAPVGQRALPGCPYLGLDEDRATHFTFAHEAHLCFALARASTIDEEFQATHCLSDRFSECVRFIAAEEGAELPAPGAVARDGVALAAADRGARVASRFGHRPIALPRGRFVDDRPQLARWLIGLLVVLVILVVAGGLFGAFPIGFVPAGAEGAGTFAAPSESIPAVLLMTPSPVAARPNPTPSAAVAAATASRSPAPAPTPQISAQPSPAPTPTQPSSVAPTATPAPTRRPAATRTPAPPAATPTPRVYVVRAGDTLSAIAVRFRTTVDRIQRANGLSDPSLIRPGQQLVIP